MSTYRLQYSTQGLCEPVFFFSSVIFSIAAFCEQMQAPTFLVSSSLRVLRGNTIPILINVHYMLRLANLTSILMKDGIFFLILIALFVE